MASLKNTIINDTGFLQLPSGTTAQRPASPANGMMRYNTTLNVVEMYNGATSTWNTVAANTYTVDVLIAAGGGGGGAGGTPYYGGGGGGGAGGLRVITNISVTQGTSYAIVVGAGGLGAMSNDGSGSIIWAKNGGDSSALGYTSLGGGAGGSYNGVGPYWVGQAGGSGGGSGRDNTGNNGAGTAGQGNSGGTAYAGSYASAGGGGGAGEAGWTGGADGSGQSGATGTQSAGGIGLTYSWTGTNIYYCGGGGGSFSSAVGGTGGVGGRGFNDGGGNGSGSRQIGGTNGLANRGQGGGGATMNLNTSNGGWGSTGYNGGSGVVLIRYAGPPVGFGGIITQSGGYTCHQFNGSGNFIA